MLRTYKPISTNINPLSTNPTKWSNTQKQFVGNSVVEHFVGLGLKGLSIFGRFRQFQEKKILSRSIMMADIS